MSEETTMLSRSGNTGDGKKTERLDIPMSEELKAECTTMATINGLPVSEWARNVLEEALHGKLGMVRRMTRRNSFGPSDESGR